MKPIFVYGSLQDKDVLTKLIGEHSLSFLEAELRGYECLYVKGQNYPNIQIASNSQVIGKLVYGLSEEHIPLLDDLEEGYERKLCTVYFGGNKKAQAHVYFGSEIIDPNRPFDFPEWLHTHKSKFLSCQTRWQFMKVWQAEPRCRLCGADAVDPFEACMEFRKKKLIQTRHYWQCKRCDYVFLDESELPTPSEEKVVYELHENSPQDEAYVEFLSQLVGPMKEHLSKLNPSASLLEGLDFGCGPGPTIESMFAQDASKTKCQIQNYDPLFFPSPSPWQGQFDFICSTEVFEHLHNPSESIQKLWSVLKPGGLIGVMTSLRQENISFADWHYRRDPTHVGFFSKFTVDWLQKHLGAELRHLSRNTFLLRKF